MKNWEWQKICESMWLLWRKLFGWHISQNCFNLRFFRAEMSFYLNEIRRNIVGNGSASSKKLAAQDCALSLVRQLFHMKLIDAAEVGQVQPKKLKLEVRMCFWVYWTLSLSLTQHLVCKYHVSPKLYKF